MFFFCLLCFFFICSFLAFLKIIWIHLKIPFCQLAFIFVVVLGITKCKSHFILPCCIELCRYCIFFKVKVCGNLVLSKSISTIFPTALVHFMSLCHILVIFTIFQTFPLLLYLLWWSIVSNLLCHWKQLFCPFTACPFLFPSIIKRV